MNIHAHYDCLTTFEREFVDACFAEIFNDARLQGIPLNGTDPAERAVDALAKLIMVSRPKPPAPKYRPPRRIPRPTMTAAEKAQLLENERNSFDKWAANARP